LGDEKIKGLLRPFGEFASSRCEHLSSSGHRSDRRTQFVADLRGETFFAFDTGLNGIGHVVEGDDEATEFGVVGRFEAGIE
jgi:hypothetical protein